MGYRWSLRPKNYIIPESGKKLTYIRNYTGYANNSNYKGGYYKLIIGVTIPLFIMIIILIIMS